VSFLAHDVTIQYDRDDWTKILILKIEQIISYAILVKKIFCKSSLKAAFGLDVLGLPMLLLHLINGK